MKSISLLMITGIITAFCNPGNINTQQQSITTTGGNGFAVVELFTSEGCSSCPPADKLVEKIKKDNPGRPIYIMAFHVDYWNYMGWKDAFSDAAFTARQRKYADWLHLETVYTPQIVINGQHEYVGSDESNIVKTIDHELAQASVNTLTLKGRVEGNKAIIDYTTTPEKNTELVLALVQHSAQSNVKAGENTGKKLDHVQIVRQLLRVDMKNKKAATMDLPKDFNKQNWELIGFIQNKRDGRITAAARIDFQS